MHIEDRLRSHTPASWPGCSMHENLASLNPREFCGLDSFTFLIALGLPGE